MKVGSAPLADRADEGVRTALRRSLDVDDDSVGGGRREQCRHVVLGLGVADAVLGVASATGEVGRAG